MATITITLDDSYLADLLYRLSLVTYIKKVNVDKKGYEVPFTEGTAVHQAWKEWEQFRKEKKQTLKPTTVKHQLKFLGGKSDAEIIAILNQSIKNGWTGLFEIKTNLYGTTINGRNTQGQVRRADAIIEERKDFGKF